MRRSVTLIFIVLLMAPFIQASSHSVSVEKTVTDESLIYYEDAGVVSYPAIRSGDEVVKRKNWSVEKWVAWEAGDIATPKVREVIKNRLGTLDGLTTGLGGNGQPHIEVGYVTTEGEQPSFSFETLKTETPEQVEATIHFSGETYTTTIPVIIKKTKAAQTDSADFQKGRVTDNNPPPDKQNDYPLAIIAVVLIALVLIGGGIVSMELDLQTIKALSSPTRVKILNLLHEGEATPVWLSEELEKSQSTIVTHLNTLQEAGLVEKDKQDGRRRVVYRPTKEANIIADGKERRMKFSLFSSNE